MKKPKGQCPDCKRYPSDPYAKEFGFVGGGWTCPKCGAREYLTKPEATDDIP